MTITLNQRRAKKKYYVLEMYVIYVSTIMEKMFLIFMREQPETLEYSSVYYYTRACNQRIIIGAIETPPTKHHLAEPS
jgi:hypothetical protein